MKLSSSASLVALAFTVLALPLALTGCNQNSSAPATSDTTTNTPPAAPDTNAAPAATDTTTAPATTTTPASDSSKTDTNAAPAPTTTTPAAPSQDSK